MTTITETPVIVRRPVWHYVVIALLVALLFVLFFDNPVRRKINRWFDTETIPVVTTSDTATPKAVFPPYSQVTYEQGLAAGKAEQARLDLKSEKAMSPATPGLTAAQIEQQDAIQSTVKANGDKLDGLQASGVDTVVTGLERYESKRRKLEKECAILYQQLVSYQAQGRLDEAIENAKQNSPEGYPACIEKIWQPKGMWSEGPVIPLIPAPLHRSRLPRGGLPPYSSLRERY